MPVSLDSLTKQLIENGIRPSFQRAKVLEYLRRNATHPTADEIFHALAPEIPSLSKATVYNTLHVMIEAGLVRSVSLDEAEMRYDLAGAAHGHFKCDACGKIVDFAIDVDQLSSANLDQFDVKAKHVFFTGLCPSCRSKFESPQ